ncbi:MAG: heavy-metal-associated domain-containing protein, partial [Tidjanibacter sp.]|nr:heavy-metal-associated domain-containing protein [Tidjanibacter sp.]
GCGCGADEVAHNVEHRFRVEGMHCNKCKANVERVLLGVEGVESVSVDLATGDVVVRGTVADVQLLHRAVESIGFEVSPK